MENFEPRFYEQNHSTINGRNVWHYLSCTPVGNYHLIHWEQKDLTIKEAIIVDDLDKAERKYSHICMQMLKGKI